MNLPAENDWRVMARTAGFSRISLLLLGLQSRAGLVRSVRQMQAASPGLVTHNLLTSEIDFENAG